MNAKSVAEKWAAYLAAVEAEELAARVRVYAKREYLNARDAQRQTIESLDCWIEEQRIICDMEREG